MGSPASRAVFQNIMPLVLPLLFDKFLFEIYTVHFSLRG